MRSKLSLVIIAALLALIVFLFTQQPSRQKHEYEQKVVLAQEVHKVMDSMMQDLRAANPASIQGIPSDGRWYSKLSFKQAEAGVIEYSLDSKNQLCRLNKGHLQVIAQYISALQLRRFTANPSIMEIRLQAKNDASLMFNFKVRMSGQ